jgi:hypothetical protein
MVSHKRRIVQKYQTVLSMINPIIVTLPGYGQPERAPGPTPAPHAPTPCTAVLDGGSRAGQHTRTRDVERRVGAQVAVIQLGAQGGVRQQLQHARQLRAADNADHGIAKTSNRRRVQSVLVLINPMIPSRSRTRGRASRARTHADVMVRWRPPL